MFLPATSPCIKALGRSASILSVPDEQSWLTVQSPAAYTSGIVVSWVMSVMIPFSTLPPASDTSSVLGLTPTATTTMSKSTVMPFVSFAEFSANCSTLAPRINFVPLSSICFCIISPARTSRILGSILSARSTTVMSALRRYSASAHLSPISPAPIISTLVFSFTFSFIALALSQFIKVNLSFTFSSPAIGGTNGFEPVATSSLSYCTFPPFSRVT